MHKRMRCQAEWFSMYLGRSGGIIPRFTTVMNGFTYYRNDEPEREKARRLTTLLKPMIVQQRLVVILSDVYRRLRWKGMVLCIELSDSWRRYLTL